MKNWKALCSLLFLVNSCFCQTLSKAGDGWDLKIDSAISLIKNYDIDKYIVFTEVCERIDFWNSSFSSTGIVEGRYTILVADADIKLNSINNLACVLVHESQHLFYAKEGIVMSEAEEEYKCYMYELSFIKKIPTPESWLLTNLYEKLQQYRQ